RGRKIAAHLCSERSDDHRPHGRGPGTQYDLAVPSRTPLLYWIDGEQVFNRVPAVGFKLGKRLFGGDCWFRRRPVEPSRHALWDGALGGLDLGAPDFVFVSDGHFRSPPPSPPWPVQVRIGSLD